jgi:hypothetical protein
MQGTVSNAKPCHPYLVLPRKTFAPIIQWPLLFGLETLIRLDTIFDREFRGHRALCPWSLNKFS